MIKENIKPMPLSEQEGEVDFIFLAQKLWGGRKVIVKSLVIFTIIGLFVAFLSPKEYTASSTMVPQVTDPKSKLGALSGLAAMAGVNMSTSGNSELAPSIYPQIISSVPYQLELMKTLLNFENLEKPVTLFDYYTKIKGDNTLMKFTVGLPYVILKAIKGSSGNRFPVSPDAPYQLTDNQISVQKIMLKTIGLGINEKDGYITLNCSLPEAYASAQLAKSAQLLLQRYITEFKIQKAQANRDFIQQRYDEAKQKYQQAQKELALFRDRNKNVSTATARTEQEQLTGEYSLIYGVYSDLAKKLEQSKIEVKEETPVFTIIKPVTVPTEKSRPNRPVILAVSVFIGLILGNIIVLGKDFMMQVREKWIGHNQ